MQSGFSTQSWQQVISKAYSSADCAIASLLTTYDSLTGSSGQSGVSTMLYVAKQIPPSTFFFEGIPQIFWAAECKCVIGVCMCACGSFPRAV